MMNGEEASSENPSGVQGICPDGWHVPSAKEWYQMEKYLNENGYACGDNSVNRTVAKALAADVEWVLINPEDNINECAPASRTNNNTSGFTALPAGNYSTIYDFMAFNSYAAFWNCTELGFNDYVSCNTISSNSASPSSMTLSKQSAASVRCVKNPEPEEANCPSFVEGSEQVFVDLDGYLNMFVKVELPGAEGPQDDVSMQWKVTYISSYSQSQTVDTYDAYFNDFSNGISFVGNGVQCTNTVLWDEENGRPYIQQVEAILSKNGCPEYTVTFPVHFCAYFPDFNENPSHEIMEINDDVNDFHGYQIAIPVYNGYEGLVLECCAC
jgi:uncharacterized protein (TIGR02145 family)